MCDDFFVRFPPGEDMMENHFPDATVINKPESTDDLG
jgi:hypothetical protein